MRWDAEKLQAFVLSTASAADLAAATGGGVSPLPPARPLALAEAVAYGPPSGPVLVVGTKAQEQLVRTQATFAVARWPELRVAWRAVPMTALAVANAAAVAARSALAPTLAVRSFDLVLERMWSGAWVRSVAGLHEPAPGLGQHLRSWLPGRGYLVVHRPRPRIVAVAGAVQDQGLLPVEGGSLLLVGAAGAPRVTATVMAMAGTSALRNVPAIVDAKRQYGTDQAIEFAGVQVVLDEPALVATGECPSCYSPLATRICPFCHAAARLADLARRAG